MTIKHIGNKIFRGATKILKFLKVIRVLKTNKMYFNRSPHVGEIIPFPVEIIPFPVSETGSVTFEFLLKKFFDQMSGSGKNNLKKIRDNSISCF